MTVHPHKIVVMNWRGQKDARVYWCPIRQTYLFEGDQQGRNGGCLECGKRIEL